MEKNTLANKFNKISQFMKKSLLYSFITCIMLAMGMTVRAEIQQKTLINVDFANGIPAGWKVSGGSIVDGALVITAGEEHFLQTPAISLKEAINGGLFKVAIEFAIPAIDASVNYVSGTLDKYYVNAEGEETKTNVGYPFFYNPAGAWASYIPESGWQSQSITSNISAQVCPDQRVSLRMSIPGGTYDFKVKSFVVTCDVEVEEQEEEVPEDKIATLIDEDFSLFPSYNPEDLYNASTDELNAKYTKVPGWKAHGIQSLGGSARLQSRGDYIQTPVFDFNGNGEGKFTVTCKVANPHENATMWIYVDAIYNDQDGQEVKKTGFDKPSSDKGYYVTIQPQDTVEIKKYFVLTKEECPSQTACILFHDAYDGTEFYIDDVKVTMVSNNEAEPDALLEIAPATHSTSDIYNLMGQKVAAKAKGIRIENGKKILQK